jgi:hypothetical protein
MSKNSKKADTASPNTVTRAAHPIAGTRRTDAALRPSTPLEAIVSRALDQELEWFFAYAETALHRESVGILPSYAAVRVLATEPTDEVCRVKAHELAHTVQACLRALPDRHASVLRAAYMPRRWPKNIENVFHALAPVVVRLAFADDPWPARSARSGLEEAAAARLSAALTGKRPTPVARLKAQAQRLFGSAVVAYTKVRALEAPALALQ